MIDLLNEQQLLLIILQVCVSLFWISTSLLARFIKFGSDVNNLVFASETARDQQLNAVKN